MTSIVASLILLISSMQIQFAEKKEIFFADVTIFSEGGKYYLTGTIGNNKGPSGFSVLVSENLKTWSIPAESGDSLGMILTKGGHTFGTKGFWAPQIFREGDTYYLTYTADEQTALASSKSLLGPYTQANISPIDSSAKNIDSFIFRDDNGKHYFYSVRFSNGNYLWAAEFDLEKGKIKTETLRKCFDATEAWEDTPNYKSAPVMEGPTVIKLKDKYYLFYSANHFMNIDYAVGYAISDSPFGPWIKQKNSPVIHRSVVAENGSGHGDIFEGPQGELYYVYHVHYSQNRVSPRKTRIVPLIKEWDPENRIFRFRVKADEVIVPVIAEN